MDVRAVRNLYLSQPHRVAALRETKDHYTKC